MAAFGIAYSPSGGGSYNVVLNDHTDRAIARQYDGSASFERTASGGASLTGRSSRQKYVWAVSSIVDKAVALELDDLFRAWDQDRADGQAAACGVSDQTFGSQVDANVVFTTPPAYIWLSPSKVQVDFAVAEV